MDESAYSLAGAFVLGIMTSIAPCPLTTNIAAISFIGKQTGGARKTALSGVLYVFGRVAAYVALASVIAWGISSQVDTFDFAQRIVNKVIGPILILLGMVLLELITIPVGNGVDGDKMQGRAERWGMPGAFFIGVLFALAFCPTTALYFGKLIHFTVKEGFDISLPFVYGIGTGLPVLFFAFLLAFGTQYVGVFFTRIQTVELWLRRITGTIFISLGIYYSLIYIFRLNLS